MANSKCLVDASLIEIIYLNKVIIIHRQFHMEKINSYLLFQKFYIRDFTRIGNRRFELKFFST